MGPLPVLIAGPEDLTRVAAAVPPAARRMAAALWPGPLTIVLRRAPPLRGIGAEDDIVAVRVPSLDITREIIERVGGVLIVAGAARPGYQPPGTAGDALRRMGGVVDLVVDGGPCADGQPSSMVDCSGSRPRLLREGALSRARLSRAALAMVM
jgi:L-threonylcarbamoyladenylate synthase